MRALLIASSLALVCAACGTSSSQPEHFTPSPISRAGDKMCSVHYQGSGKTTKTVIQSLSAGKLEITSSSTGGAEEQTKTLLDPETITLQLDGNPLIALAVTLTAPAGHYVCSVHPAS